MPEITVTETQRERLAAIEGDLDAAYIDTYGCIRTEDVVQYLLDTYTPPEQRGGERAYERIATADFQSLQAVAADVEDVPGSGIDAATMRGKLLSTLGAEAFAERLAEVDDTETERSVESDGATDTASDASSPEIDSAEDTGSDGDAEADAGDETESDPGPTPSTDGPGAILSAANQLLDDHDDKWRDGGADEPYEVDLPDGTTETVRTKDDIRGLLFKHY